MLMLSTACSGTGKQSNDMDSVSEDQEKDIVVTISCSSKFPVQSASPTTIQSSTTQSDKIQHIRDIYYRIVGNQNSYQQFGGRYYTAGGVLVKEVISNGNAVLDEIVRKMVTRLTVWNTTMRIGQAATDI